MMLKQKRRMYAGILLVLLTPGTPCPGGQPTQPTSTEEKINDALQAATPCEFIETPLEQVLAFFADIRVSRLVSQKDELIGQEDTLLGQKELLVRQKNELIGKERKQRQRAEREEAETRRQLNRARCARFDAQLLKVSELGGKRPEQARHLLEDTEACPLDLRDFSWRLSYCFYGRDSLGGEPEATTFKVPEMVTSVAFSADGKMLAIGTTIPVDDGRTFDRKAFKETPSDIKVFDVATGEELESFRGHHGMVASLAFSPDGNTLASIGGDRELKLWDVATRLEAPAPVQQTVVWSAVFSPDGQKLAVAGFGQIELWHVATRKKLAILNGHAGPVTSLAFAPSGQTIVAGDAGKRQGHPGNVKLWNVASGKELYSLEGFRGPVRSVTFAPDGQTVAAAGNEGYELPAGTPLSSVRLWNVASRKETLTIRVNGDVPSIAYTRDGRALAGGISVGESLIKVGGEVGPVPAGVVSLWDPTTGQERMTVKGRVGPVVSIAFAPDGEALAIGSKDKTVKLWKGIKPPWNVGLGDLGENILCVAFAADGKMLASGNGQYENRTGEPSLAK